MQSSVHWAVLGLVIERPSYGYELANRFEIAYGDMLNLSGASYVYRALEALQRRALIELISVPRAVRQPKLRYRATSDGVRAYQERLVRQMREECRRPRLLARQLAVFAKQPEIALEILERCEQVCLEESTSAPIGSPHDSAPDVGLAGRLVSEGRRMGLEGKIPWVQSARREFEALVTSRLSRR
jgi:DNA-binding PadR family transcriptional regulator